MKSSRLHTEDLGSQRTVCYCGTNPTAGQVLGNMRRILAIEFSERQLDHDAKAVLERGLWLDASWIAALDPACLIL